MADPQAQDALATLTDFGVGWDERDAEYQEQYVEALAVVRARLEALEQERDEARDDAVSWKAVADRHLNDLRAALAPIPQEDTTT